MPRYPVLACLLAAVAFGSTASARAAAPLVAQWPLDSSHAAGVSDVTDDVSGNGLALAAPAGTMQFGSASGRFGPYLAGANTTTLKVDSPLLAPPQVTLLAWIKQAGDPGNLKYIAGRGDDGGTCSGSSYALYTGYAAKPGLHFYVRSPTTSALSDAPANAAVFDGQWHLVAGTFDGSNVRLYVDGTPVGDPQPVPDGINYALPGGTSFYVDGYPVGLCGPSDWPGTIDEVRVYDRALTQTELGRLAAAPGPGAPDLVPDEAPPPPPPPAATGPRDHALLGKVTYEPGFGVGDDRDSVLSPFVARPAPRGLTVTLVDSTGAAVASRALTGSDIAASLYVPVLYRFDGLGACSGCALVLSDNSGVQDRVTVDFDGEAGQTDADLVYGRARTGGTVTGGVLAPSSIRATTLRVVVRGSDNGVLADTAKLRSCGSSGSGCRSAARYVYRLTGLPQAAVPVVAELDQQTAKGRFVAVDTAPFALDASGATTVPDLTALADPPPDGSGRVLHGQMNVVAPFAPGAHTRSELDAPDRLLRDARVELHAANGALVKRVTQGFNDGRASGFTTYTMAGLAPCSGCTMQLRRGSDLVDSVPVTVPARTPSVTSADLDFRDGKPAFVDGVVRAGTRAEPVLSVAALDPLTGAVLASTPQGSQHCASAGAGCATAVMLPYRLGGAPAGRTVLLALRSRSTILDSRLVELSPEGQVTQAPVLMVPSAGSGRVLQGAVYAAGPFGPGLVAASLGKPKLTVVLRGDDGAELARANVAPPKGAKGADAGYALSGLPPCAECTIELLSGTTLEDRAAVTIRPEPAAVTVADLGAGAISGGAYVQGALIPRHGERVVGVTVQVRGSDGKVLADSAQIRGDSDRPGTAAHPLYRLGGIPRDAGIVTVVVLAGRAKLASARVTIPVGAGDAHVPDLQIDVPKAGRAR